MSQGSSDQPFSSSREIRLALQRVGELLEARGLRFEIVIVGGAALNLLGIIERSTVDVDVIAMGEGVRPMRLREPADPLPRPLADAVATVARDMNLPADWMNPRVAGQWALGVPEGFQARIRWETLGGLEVGVSSRTDLIHLKLYAACDATGPQSRHFVDLMALSPTSGELAAAATWVVDQDAGLASIVEEVIKHVRSRMG